MSRSLRKRIAGALAVAAIAGGSLTLTAGEASAVPTCNSPALTGCVQINNNTRDIHSYRLQVIQPNGHSWTRCLIGVRPGGWTSRYPGVWFSYRDAVFTSVYTGNNCEGWSKTSNVRMRWDGPNEEQWWVLSATQG